MKCPNCQFDNPAGMKFCVDCGTKVAVACSQCGAEMSPSYRFCGECGHALSTAGDPAAVPAAGAALHNHLTMMVAFLGPYFMVKQSEEAATASK